MTRSLYLIGLILLLLTIYVSLLSLCGFYSYPLIMNRNDAYHHINDERLYEILADMANDIHHCFHCIERHVGAKDLESFMGKKSVSRERNRNLKLACTIFNILSINTSFITFLVFGGSKLIYFISFCCSCLIFASIYVENNSDVIIFESSALIFSSIVFLKCFYAILFAIIVIERQKKR